MAPLPTSRLIIVTAVLAGVVVVGGLIWRRSLGQTLAGWTGRMIAPVAVRVRSALNFMHQYVGRGDLVSENIRLTRELAQAQSAAAIRDDLQRQNDFLQVASGIHDRVHRDLLAGEVFSYLSDGVSRQIVVNRGSRDGVLRGDIVLTGASELVGVVADVFDDHAMVKPLGDPNLEVTARIMNTDVSGLVRTDVHQDLVIDLIQKAETVTEGQTVVTSGNDQFPAGMVIGVIRSVDSESAALFKIVRITPAIANTFIGRVVIMHP